jgi:hypothetical protein
MTPLWLQFFGLATLVVSLSGCKDAPASPTPPAAAPQLILLPTASNLRWPVPPQYTARFRAVSSFPDGSYSINRGDPNEQWTFSDPAVADLQRMSDGSLVTTRATGHTTLTVVSLGQTASLALEVNGPPLPAVPVPLSLSYQRDPASVGGRLGQITARALRQDGGRTTYNDVTDLAEWRVSDVTFATVVRGRVTGARVGTCIVTAAYGGMTASLLIAFDPIGPERSQ